MNILKFDITARSLRASTTSGQEQEVSALFFSLVIDDVKLTDEEGFRFQIPVSEPDLVIYINYKSLSN